MARYVIDASLTQNWTIEVIATSKSEARESIISDYERGILGLGTPVNDSSLSIHDIYEIDKGDEYGDV